MFLQLDSGNSQNCSGRTITYVNLLDGSHSFNVAVNTSSGLQFSSVYTWSVGNIFLCLHDPSTFNPHSESRSLKFGFWSKPLKLKLVSWFHSCKRPTLFNYPYECVVIACADTVPPTAQVTTAELFTNAVNITVFINFTESCSGHGGFQCPNISSCDVSLLKLTSSFCYSWCHINVVYFNSNCKSPAISI